MVARVAPLRVAAAALLAGALVGPAPAQLVALHLRDDAARRRHERHLVDLGNERVVVGEPRSGLSVRGARIFVRGEDVELWVGDPSDPGWLPYRIDDEGGLVARGRRGVLVLGPDEVERAVWFDRVGSLAALAREWDLREAEIDGLREALAEAPRGSAEWAAVAWRLLDRYRRLESWLERGLHAGALDRVERRRAQLERSLDEARGLRLARDLETIASEPVPDSLREAGADLAGDPDLFRVVASRHVRLVHGRELSPRRAEQLVTLGERAVEAFRAQLVDPYRDQGLDDSVLDGVFQELYLGPPDEPELHRALLERHYGLSWEPFGGEVPSTTGTSHVLADRHLNYRRVGPLDDLDGVVVHVLGHTLADLHYNRARGTLPQAWVREGAGRFLALELLGRDTLQCYELEPDVLPRYGQHTGAKLRAGGREAPLATRELLTMMALEHGPSPSALALRSLYQMNDADLAKSWSLFAFAAEELGLEGQLWLRAACDAGGDEATLVETWRAESEALFDVRDEDVFRVLDQRWRAWAERSLE